MLLHCRIADTRVLRTLLASLKSPQALRVGQAIETWQWFNRYASIESRALPLEPVAHADPEPHLKIDASQFATLLDASEADSLFLQLLDMAPELVPKAARAEFHDRLRAVLATASTLNVIGTTDRLQFVVLSLTCGNTFHRHDDLAETWRAVREEQASLSELMQSWNEALWASLEAGAT